MWIKFDENYLKTSLLKDELDILSNLSKADYANLLKITCEEVADLWRSHLRKYHKIDSRMYYIPTSCIIYILAHTRYCVYTRLPNSGVLLDERRIAEYNKAMDFLENGIKRIKLEEPEEEEEDSDIYANPKIIKNKRARRFE